MAQNVQIGVSVNDQASPKLGGLAGRFDDLQKKVTNNGPAINRLNGSLQQLATQAAGVPGPLGAVTQALLAFGPTSIAVTAAVTGIGLVINGFNGLKSAQENAANAQADFERQFMETRAVIGGGDPLQARLDAETFAYERALLKVQDAEKKYLDARAAREANVGPEIFPFIERRFQEAEAERTRAISEAYAVRTRLIQAERALAEAASFGVRQLAQDYGKLRQLQESGATLSEQELVSITSLQQRLQAIANNTAASYQDRLAAQTALGRLEQKELEDVDKIREERYRALLQLQQQNRLTVQDQFELNNIERIYLAILNDGTKSAEERAKALGLLSGYYDRLKKQEQDAIDRQNQMNDSLERFNTALQTRQRNLDAAGINLLNLPGVATETVRSPLESRLIELRQQVSETSNIIEQSGLIDQITRIEDALLSDMSQIGGVLYNDLEKLKTFGDLAANSYDVLFNTIANGGGTLTSFGQAMLRMFAQVSRTKVVENLASGFENLAKAAGFAAIGNLPGAAAAKAAAGLHFKAAAAWGAVGIGFAAVSGANGGFGAGGGAGAIEVEQMRGQATLIINGGFLDMNDPRQLQELQRALSQFSGRRVVVQGR